MMMMIKCEGKLRKTAADVNKILKIYDMKISIISAGWMGFCGKWTERVKTEIEGKIVERFLTVIIRKFNIYWRIY